MLEQAKLWTFRVSSPLVPGDETRTYTLRSPFPIKASGTRHVLLRPTDVPGATFAVESVRLVFRKERIRVPPRDVGY